MFWESSVIWPIREELGEFLTDFDETRYVGWKWDFKMIFWESFGIWPVQKELGEFLTDFNEIFYAG